MPDPTAPPALRVRLARTLAPTGAPWAWATCGGAVAGLLAGFAIAGAVPGEPMTSRLGAGIIGLLVGGLGWTVPRPAALRTAAVVAAATFVCGVTGYLVAGHVLLATLATGLVMVAASALSARAAALMVLAQVGWMSFLLAAALGRLLPDLRGRPLLSVAAVCLAGAVGGVLVVAPRLLGLRPAAAANPPEDSAALGKSGARVAATDALYLRDGVRRALVLAPGMAAFQATGSRTVLWGLVAMAVVLLPAGKPPLVLAVVRVVATLVAVLAVELAHTVLPVPVLAGTAVVGVAVGALALFRWPALLTAGTTYATVVLVALPGAAYGAWEVRRLGAVVVGVVIALLVQYLVWPRDREHQVDPAVIEAV